MSSQLHSGSMAISLSAWPATENKSLLAGFAAARQGPPYPDPRPLPTWEKGEGYCHACGEAMERNPYGYLCATWKCSNNPLFRASATTPVPATGETP